MKSLLRSYAALPLFTLLLSQATQAQEADALTDGDKQLIKCLQTQVLDASDTTRVEEIKAVCKQLVEDRMAGQSDESVSDTPQETLTERRVSMELVNRTNRFMLTPHNRNYVLPVSYKHHHNADPFVNANSELKDLQHVEVEFQLSVKILMRENIFGNNGHLYIAYTNLSFWQAYNKDISRPFRETNHQPELLLRFIHEWEVLGFRNVLSELSLNHQSNGQKGLLSRSWNRVMFNTVFERGNFGFAVKPWYRIPESEKEDDDDVDGDDNPDIEKYLGHFEFSAAYYLKKNIFSVMLRNNLSSDNKGAIDLSWSFPVSSTVRGYVTYFDGYGHSMLDYNVNTKVLGLGVVFTDIF